jgi:maltase-glucoamylase
MNEPANFDTNLEKPWNWPSDREPWNLVCPENEYDDPEYLPLIAKPFGQTRRISDKTLCMRGKQGPNDEYMHYDVHNLYGWSQTEPTLRYLKFY